jgi:hypothetical protein
MGSTVLKERIKSSFQSYGMDLVDGGSQRNDNSKHEGVE